jgi:IS4 transposase
MFFDDVFRPFIEQSPVSVMFRGTLEHIFAAPRLDGLFERTAQRQCCRDLAFSTCADLLGLVVTQVQPSLHAAYRARCEQVGVSVQALYQKVAGVEPRVCEALVRETAADLAAIIDAMDAALPGPLPGFEVRIVDGNHLQGTQHRLKELRRLGDAALPGHTLAVLNPHRELIEEVVVCTDGHANQKPLFRFLLDKVLPRQCWIADRDFSTREFLFGVKQRHAYFLVRHHGGLGFETVGRQRRLGRTDTGVVYEQNVRLSGDDGQEMIVRRITIKLDRPTRDKETEIHLLTNLPQKVTGQKIAAAYLSRWKIENAFHKLTMVLRCELNTLGYPQAALFGFCLAVVMYNVVHTVTAALRGAHPDALEKTAGKATKFSFYYLADEIAGVSRGMAIVVAAEYWTKAFAHKTPLQMAKQLRWLARKVRVERYLTNPASEKKRKARRPIKHGGHVSTQRILQKRKLITKKR